MRAGHLAAGVGLLIATSADQRAAASPQDVIGYGPRASALAGSGVAFGRGFETVYSNPSLLVLSKNMELDLGHVGVTFDLEAGGPIGTDGVAAGMLGGVLPIPLPDPLADRIVFGFGFLTPFDLVVRGRILYPETPQFLLTDAVQSIAAIVGLGVDIGWGLHIGGGFEALAALTGTALASVDSTGQLTAVVQDTLVANYAPVVGASYDIPGGYRVGVTFRGPLEGRFDVRIDIKDLGSITVPPIFVSGMAQYDPMHVEAEIARVEGPLKGSVAVGYRRWSAYPGLAEATVRCPIPIDTFDYVPCGALAPIDLDFDDTAVVRGSFEGTITPRRGIDLDLRVGYSFESAAGPLQTGETNVFAEARSVVGLGVGIAIGEPHVKGLHVDGFAQVGAIHGRDHDKADGSETIRTSGTMLAGGTVLGVAF